MIFDKGVLMQVAKKIKFPNKYLVVGVWEDHILYLIYGRLFYLKENLFELFFISWSWFGFKYLIIIFLKWYFIIRRSWDNLICTNNDILIYGYKSFALGVGFRGAEIEL